MNHAATRLQSVMQQTTVAPRQNLRIDLRGRDRVYNTQLYYCSHNKPIEHSEHRSLN